MTAGVLNLSIEQGATFRLPITWKTGTPRTVVNLTGYTARMQLRRVVTDELPLISITDTLSSEGQVILGGVLGTIEVFITDTATEELVSGGVYDLELIAPNDDVKRLVQGRFSLSLNVTRG